MTPKELSDLIHTLEPDRLLTKPAVGFWLQGNDVKNVDACLAYCEANGLLCRVERAGVAKWYRDGEIVEQKPVVQPTPPPEPVAPPKPKRTPKPITVAPQLFNR